LFSYCLAIRPAKLNKLIEPASRLEQRVGEVVRESGAVALLPAFQIAEEPSDVREQQITDLRLLVERRVYVRKRVL
jgi:hypothetical protein